MKQIDLAQCSGKNIEKKLFKVVKKKYQFIEGVYSTKQQGVTTRLGKKLVAFLIIFFKRKRKYLIIIYIGENHYFCNNRYPRFITH